MRELRDSERNRHLRIHKNIHTVDDFIVAKLDRADLYDMIRLRRKASRLDIEHDGLLVKTLSFIICYDCIEIIDEVSLTAIEKLKILIMTDF